MIREIEYLRGMAILAVLCQHVGGYIDVNSLTSLTLVVLFLRTASTFAVPLFLFISGFILTQKYNGDFKNFYKKKFVAVFVPFAVMEAFYLLYYNHFHSLAQFATVYWNAMVLWDRSSLVEYFWYFKAFLPMLILFPLIVKYYSKYLIPISFLAHFAIRLMMYYRLDLDFVNWATFIDNGFYFLIGMYISKNLEASKAFLAQIPSSYLLISAMCLTGLDVWIILSKYPRLADALVLPGIAILMTVFLIKTYHNSNILEKIGNYSFGIYLVHKIFLMWIVASLQSVGVGYDSITFYAVSFPVVLGGSYFVMRMCQKIPYSYLAVGKIRS